MQQFLDDRKHMAFSMVDHLRWDLKQILDLAVAKGVIRANPVYVHPGTILLFVPKECAKPKRPVMTIDQIKKALEVLDLRAPGFQARCLRGNALQRDLRASPWSSKRGPC